MDGVRRIGPFYPCSPVTSDGAIAILPTEGHTPGHVSVLVSTEDRRYFLAGDTSYTQDLLIKGASDGVAPSPSKARRTLDRIMALASRRPMVYLPSHDPDSKERLRDDVPVPTAEGSAAMLSGIGGVR